MHTCVCSAGKLINRGEYSSLLDHSGDLMKIGWRGDFGSIWRGDFGRVFFWTFWLFFGLFDCFFGLFDYFLDFLTIFFDFLTIFLDFLAISLTFWKKNWGFWEKIEDFEKKWRILKKNGGFWKKMEGRFRKHLEEYSPLAVSRVICTHHTQTDQLSLTNEKPELWASGQ